MWEYAEASAPTSGAWKSPPTAIPRSGLRKLIEKTPPAAVAGIVESVTVQVRPRFAVWKIREAPPPDAR